MEVVFTRASQKDYRKLSQEVQKQFDKQLLLLVENMRHPSLNLKKIKGAGIIWEGRINKGYRFTFEIQGNLYIIRRAGTHQILQNP